MKKNPTAAKIKQKKNLNLNNIVLISIIYILIILF